jgi:drug/metabolite transporter (DMT)-like permease
VWSVLSVVYVVWGSTYLAIAFLVETMPPLLSMGVRFICAAALLGAIVAVRQGPRALAVSRANLRATLLVAALLLGGGLGAVTLAEEAGVASGVAALLVASMPLWLVLLRAGSGDRPSGATVAGVLTGFAGIAILVLPGGGTSGPVLAMAGILLGTLSWALGSFLSPRLPLPANPFALTTWEMLLGGLVLCAVGLLRGEAADVDAGGFSAASLWAWAYLVVVGSVVGFTAFVWLLGNARLSLISTYAYVNPVVAVLLGWLVRGEALTAAVVVGGAVTVAGVVLVVRGERPGHAG